MTRTEALLTTLGFTWNDSMEAWEWIQPQSPIILMRPVESRWSVHSMKWLHGWEDHGVYENVDYAIYVVQELMV